MKDKTMGKPAAINKRVSFIPGFQPVARAVEGQISPANVLAVSPYGI